MPLFLRFFLIFERIDLSNYELDWLESFFRGKVHVYISMKKYAVLIAAALKKYENRLSKKNVTDFPENCMHLPGDRDVQCID